MRNRSTSSIAAESRSHKKESQIFQEFATPPSNPATRNSQPATHIPQLATHNPQLIPPYSMDIQ